MISHNRRRHRRLEMIVPVYCRIPMLSGSLIVGYSLNIGPDGVCFYTHQRILSINDIIEITFYIQPTCGVFEWGGKLHGRAQVLRIQDISLGELSDDKFMKPTQVAARFIEKPHIYQQGHISVNTSVAGPVI